MARRFHFQVVRRIGVNSCILLLFGFTSGAAPAVPRLDAQSQALYAAAYQAITTGHAYGGAVELIELLRSVPGDSIDLADAFVAPSQLLGFAVASLMDWPERIQLLSEVLAPDVYPTDELLIAALKLGSGVQSMALPARMTLETLATGEHLGVRAAAVCFLASSYYFGGGHAQPPALEEMVRNHSSLEFMRCVVETPVVDTLSKAIEQDKPDANLLADVPYCSGDPRKVFEVSPGLAKAAEALPSMDVKDLTDATVTRWADGLVADASPHRRYTIISLLAKTCTTPERRSAARAGLMAVAKLPPLSPDIIRASTLLVDFDMADNRSETIESRALDLLKLAVLPCTAERSMYESVMQTAQHAARYYTRLGMHQQAVRIHETLAAKFPNTTLAVSEQEKADAIRTDGLTASLALINMEVDAPLRNGETQKVVDRYQGIVDHTPHAALKIELTRRLARIQQDVTKITAESGAGF